MEVDFSDPSPKREDINYPVLGFSQCREYSAAVPVPTWEAQHMFMDVFTRERLEGKLSGQRCLSGLWSRVVRIFFSVLTGFVP